MMPTLHFLAHIFLPKSFNTGTPRLLRRSLSATKKSTLHPSPLPVFSPPFRKWHGLSKLQQIKNWQENGGKNMMPTLHFLAHIFLPKSFNTGTPRLMQATCRNQSTSSRHRGDCESRHAGISKESHRSDIDSKHRHEFFLVNCSLPMI